MSLGAVPFGDYGKEVTEAAQIDFAGCDGCLDRTIRLLLVAAVAEAAATQVRAKFDEAVFDFTAGEMGQAKFRQAR